MNLQCRIEIAQKYKAGPQIARVLSEEWCGRELYCAACQSDRLSCSVVNTAAIDFTCPACRQSFQLKSSKAWNQRKIVDSAFSSMIRAIRSNSAPNLLVLQYSSDWTIKNLMLVPSVFFSETIIEKRAPLSSDARRAGWIGCNILIDRIPPDGKISMVCDGSPVPEKQVREKFSRIRELACVPPTLRGWTLDVLNAIRKLGKSTFSLGELYNFETYLQHIHPGNRNVRPKIRQQLQLLRDLGLIEFTAPGNYKVRG